MDTLDGSDESRRGDRRGQIDQELDEMELQDQEILEQIKRLKRN